MTSRSAQSVDTSAWPTGTLPGIDRGRQQRRAGIPFQSRQRLAMEVVTNSGRATSVELQLTPAKVEVWHHQRCSAVLDRDELRQWIAEPHKPFLEPGKSQAAREVNFCLDRSLDPAGRIALTLPDVAIWPLAPAVLHQLRTQL